MPQLDNAQPQQRTIFVSKFIAPFVGGQMLRNRTLLAVSLTICAAYTGIGMIVPVRVLYAQSRGASLGIIGAMASAYLISNFVFQYPSGWIADRWGRKRIMVISLIAQAILSLAYLFITDPVFFVSVPIYISFRGRHRGCSNTAFGSRADCRYRASREPG